MYTIYLSRVIRGEKKDNAPLAEIHKNLEDAVELGTRVQDFCNYVIAELGSTDDVIPYVFVPHAQETLNTMWETGEVTSEQILLHEIKMIEKKVDLLLVFDYDGFISEGMDLEIAAAERAGVPIIRANSYLSKDRTDEDDNQFAADIKREFFKYVERTKAIESTD